MCGICGIFGPGSKIDVTAMVRALHHRGPDDSGTHEDENISMGMARLAILDLSSAAHQPMSTPDGKIWIVYNGEMYNFKEERDILAKMGYRFASTCDTEVVLRMYEHYGDDFLVRMRAMFGLAIYDKRGGPGKEKLLLARDHLGVKPLLYSNVGNRLVFASELKALLASGLIAPNLDPEALRLLLTFGSIPQPRTAIAGVNMLLPGHSMIAQSGRQRIEKYWALSIDRVPGLRSASYDEQVERLRHELAESVRLQMVSDVPIGAFLSGGVDSSLMVAFMRQIAGTEVRTFSVGFGHEGTHLDESDAAQRLARYLGSNHSRVTITGADVRDKICHVAAALDQPSVDGVNSYFVSFAARQKVTVAISGTGGDELFAGYPWFTAMAVLAAREESFHLKGLIGSIVGPIARNRLLDSLAASAAAGSLIDRLRSASGFLPRYARCHHVFGYRSASILSNELRRSARTGREISLDIATSDELPKGDAVERVSALCLRGYMQNQLLRDIDAVSMAHSLEVRVPFIDPILVDFALSLPFGTKLGKVANLSNPTQRTYEETGAKRILIDSGKGLLPDDINRQAKSGFNMPVDAWLRNELADVMKDTLSTASVKNRGIFDNAEVEKVVQDFHSGTSHWTAPFLLLMTELWMREVADKCNYHPSRAPSRPGAK